MESKRELETQLAWLRAGLDYWDTLFDLGKISDDEFYNGVTNYNLAMLDLQDRLEMMAMAEADFGQVSDDELQDY